VINLSQLKDVQKKDEEIANLQKENEYLIMQKQDLQKNLREMHEKTAKENDFFFGQMEGHHKEMEDYFKKVQSAHAQ